MRVIRTKPEKFFVSWPKVGGGWGQEEEAISWLGLEGWQRYNFESLLEAVYRLGETEALGVG